MARSYNTKSKGLLPLDGAELNPAYGPWNSVSECTDFWKITNGLVSVPEGANCAVKNSTDGSIVKYVYKQGAWREDFNVPSGGILKSNLSADVQSSLEKADSALQQHQSIKTINGINILGTGDVFVQGEKGDKGDQGDLGPQGEKGEKGFLGNTGSSVDFPYELVNNLKTDDPEKGLSAQMGKLIGDSVAVTRKVSVNEAEVHTYELFKKPSDKTNTKLEIAPFQYEWGFWVYDNPDRKITKAYFSHPSKDFNVATVDSEGNIIEHLQAIRECNITNLTNVAKIYVGGRGVTPNMDVEETSSLENGVKLMSETGIGTSTYKHISKDDLTLGFMYVVSSIGSTTAFNSGNPDFAGSHLIDIRNASRIYVNQAIGSSNNAKPIGIVDSTGVILYSLSGAVRNVELPIISNARYLIVNANKDDVDKTSIDITYSEKLFADIYDAVGIKTVKDRVTLDTTKTTFTGMNKISGLRDYKVIGAIDCVLHLKNSAMNIDDTYTITSSTESIILKNKNYDSYRFESAVAGDGIVLEASFKTSGFSSTIDSLKEEISKVQLGSSIPKILIVSNSWGKCGALFMGTFAQSMDIDMYYECIAWNGANIGNVLGYLENDTPTNIHWNSINGSFNTLDLVNPLEVITGSDWDYFVINNGPYTLAYPFNNTSGESIRENNISKLIKKIKSLSRNPYAKIAVQMKCAFGPGRYPYKFEIDGVTDATPQDTFARITAVHKAIEHLEGVDMIIPVGTALQSYREHFGQDAGMSSDNVHTTDEGTFVNSLVWFAKFIGAKLNINVLDLDKSKINVAGLSSERIDVALQCANNAVKFPFEITIL